MFNVIVNDELKEGCEGKRGLALMNWQSESYSNSLDWYE